MQEVPFAGEHHREAELVGLLDDRVVAHRAAGLDHGRDARARRGLDAVGERVERVARARAALRAAARPSSPRSRPTRRGSAARRRCRPPGRPSRARSRSTSRGRRCATRAPGPSTARAWARPWYDPPVVARRREMVRSLHEEAARDLADVERLRARAAGASRMRVFLRRFWRASILRARSRARSRRRPAAPATMRSTVSLVDDLVERDDARRTPTARRTRARAGTRSPGRR